MHCNFPKNCRADEFAKAGALFPEVIAKWISRDAILSWVNEESCDTARFNWPLIDGRCTNQLLGLGRDIISTMVVMLTGHCVRG